MGAGAAAHACRGEVAHSTGHTAHAQGAAATGKEQEPGGRHRAAHSVRVSYTSAFVSWSTGRGALQQRENSTLQIFTGKVPALCIDTQHTDKRTEPLFDTFKYIYSQERL